MDLKAFDEYYRADDRPTSWSEQSGLIVFSTVLSTGQKIDYFFKEALYPESSTRNGYALKLEKMTFEGKEVDIGKGFTMFQMAVDDSTPQSQGNAH